MKTNIKNRKKQFLALSLSLLMASSVTALAGCNEETTSSSSSSSSSSAATAKVDSLITNANFETFNTNDGKNLISKTVSGWTRATISNLTSQSASGVINTSTENWDDLTKTTIEDPASLSVADAKAKWSTMTAKDKLLFMEAWEDANPNDKIEEKLDFITSYNVDSDDLPTCENPGIPNAEATDDNVLMIHNAYDWNDYKELGTAQKFTSSSTVTVPAGTAAKFSVWVKTSDLKTSTTEGEVQDAVDKGAFISVTHSVGNRSMDALQINNINTDDWQQYTFYVNGTAYADTTFTLVLGLGQGTSDDRWGHVSGYAFFDEIECEIITRNDYETEVADSVPTFGFENTKAEKTVDSYENKATTFALNYYGEFKAIEKDESTTYLDTVDSFQVTTETSKHNVVYTAAAVEEGTKDENGKTIVTYPGLGLSQKDAVTHVFANAAEMTTHATYKDNVLLQQVYKDYFEGKDFLKNQAKNEQVLMIMSPSGVAYTAKSGYEFAVPAGENLAISFFVKTSDLNGVTGANVSLHYGNEKYAISNLDVSDITTVDVNDDNKDIYTGWQQCLFYVKNSTEVQKTFTLSFSFGPSTVIGTTTSSYYTGFAAFAGFESYAMEEGEFASAQSGSYANIVTLKEANEKDTSTNGFDTTATVPTDAIENGYANLRNYKGVYTDSIYLGGTNKNVNAKETAGLLNIDYAENYTDILTKLGASFDESEANAAKRAQGAWTSVFGNATQPLVIYNEGAQTNAYGYIGSVQSISANTYKTVSLRMKVSAGATANVYLIDMDNLNTEKSTFDSTLSIGSKIVYWYDNDGNVCAEDPTDTDNFNAKQDIAFKLQSNGLYKVNPDWTGYSADYEGKFYANLANYEKNANGDLIVAEGGVSYDYNDKWENEGNDGIAYYCKDGKYYADKACTILVNDLSTANVPARYEAQEGKGLSFSVTQATNKDWVTVTFYIHTGNVDKNYRLEIWSGARDNSVVNGEGSYVIVDANNPNSLDATSFEENVTDRKAEDGLEGVTVESFDSAYSFFDSAKFLRYNETIDENEVKNSYDDYVSADQAKGTAYLKYSSNNVLELYADYQYAENTTSADVEEDDDHDHDHDETPEANTADLWLLGGSVLIAAVLLFAVVSLIVRKVMKNRRKSGKAPAPKKAKKEKKEKSEENKD
ncbi:MAG: hypothetical protein J6D30_00990 [Clostridia bacterium]|nr:hypothetical protein [Clostridia bacterium]